MVAQVGFVVPHLNTMDLTYRQHSMIIHTQGKLNFMKEDLVVFASLPLTPNLEKKYIIGISKI